MLTKRLILCELSYSNCGYMYNHSLNAPQSFILTTTYSNQQLFQFCFLFWIPKLIGLIKDGLVPNQIIILFSNYINMLVILLID